MIAHKHSSGEYWGGVFPVYTDTFAFLTRLVTHPCAPGFFFLMGVGMVLFADARLRYGWSRWQIMKHFLIRGALLITLQLVLVNQIWELGPSPSPKYYFGVLYALGGTMIMGSALLRLKPVYLMGITVALFVGMEIAHPDPSRWGLIFDNPIGVMLGSSGGSGIYWVNYPILPWLELVTMGMLFGQGLLANKKATYFRGLLTGVFFLILFVVLRALNGFGNIRPSPGEDWIDFLNLVKYPPSMTFTLFTMGINLVFLWIFSSGEEKLQRVMKPLAVFGRAPLFFYISHLVIYLILGLLLTPSGTSIPMMYPLWLLGLLLLYPLAYGYSRIKHQQSENSILRFF
jgi:uncharacterized membrane protein